MRIIHGACSPVVPNLFPGSSLPSYSPSLCTHRFADVEYSPHEHARLRAAGHLAAVAYRRRGNPKMNMRTRLGNWFERLGNAGTLPSDDEEERLCKTILTYC